MAKDHEQTPDDSADALRRWAAGECAGFLAAIRPWQTSVFRILHRILGNSHDAEDAWQTLVLRLWKSPGKLPVPEKFPAWLRRCAVNEAIRLLRRRKRRSESGIDEIPSPLPAPWEELTNEELRATVAGTLRTLAPDERALLTLRFDEGLTIREMAEVLERPAATVHDQLKCAVERLRSMLRIHSLEQANP